MRLNLLPAVLLAADGRRRLPQWDMKCALCTRVIIIYTASLVNAHIQAYNPYQNALRRVLIPSAYSRKRQVALAAGRRSLFIQLAIRDAVMAMASTPRAWLRKIDDV